MSKEKEIEKVIKGEEEGTEDLLKKVADFRREVLKSTTMFSLGGVDELTWVVENLLEGKEVRKHIHLSFESLRLLCIHKADDDFDTKRKKMMYPKDYSVKYIATQLDILNALTNHLGCFQENLEDALYG